VLGVVNDVVPGMSLKYNKHYVGLVRDGVADNFVQLRPRKESLLVEFRIPRSDETTALIDDSGIESVGYQTRWGRYRVRLRPDDFEAAMGLLAELVRRASGMPAPDLDLGQGGDL